jgi:hypothetical protein
MRKLNWEIITDVDRQAAIDRIKDAIMSSDGSILHFQMYSDLALGMTIEIPENRIKELYEKCQELARAQTKSDESAESIVTSLLKDVAAEWMIFLNVTFSGSTGNLEHEKPMVEQ